MTTTQLRAAVGPNYPSGTPAWLAYNPVDLSFWVAVPPSSVDVIPSSAPYNLTAVLPVGTTPFGVAVDPSTGRVFVTNTGSDNVTVLSTSTLKSVASVTVGSQPYGVAYDQGNGEVYVANGGSNNLTVFNASTLALVASIPVGIAPTGLAVDGATGHLFVTNTGSFNVTVVDTAINAVVASMPAGIQPYGVAVDNRTDTIFVTNQASVNVSVYNGTTLATLPSIPISVPGTNFNGLVPQGIAYDSATGQMWIGAGLAYLVILNASNRSVDAYLTGDPAGAAYDPVGDKVCVTNTWNSTFQCFKARYVWNVAQVTVAETGLPAGAVWNLTVNNLSGTRSNGTRQILYLCDYILFCANPKSPYLAFAPTGPYVPTPSSVIVSWKKLGPPLTVNVAFSKSAKVYPVTFLESGLAPGTGWAVAMGGLQASSTGTTLAFSEPNGTYSYSIGSVSGYSTVNSSGTVQVTGAGANVTVTFTAFQYPIVFSESGLPTGTTWFVNFTSSPPGTSHPVQLVLTGSSGSIAGVNGSYSVTVESSDKRYATTHDLTFTESGGNTVPNGTTSVVFSPYLTQVQFMESGLPSRTSWAVTLGTIKNNSTTSTIAFGSINGTDGFTVTPLPGYAESPGSGSVLVTGVPGPAIVIAFASLRDYNITFQESGLPGGTGWAVAIGNQIASSTTASLALVEPNGTYEYVVLAVPGYATNYSGAVTVNSSAVLIAVHFVPQTFPVIVVEFGLPPGTNWSVTISNSSRGFSQTQSTNGSALLFFLPNGTYTLTVHVPPGFTANLTSATFSVANARTTTPPIGFSHPTPNAVTPTPAASSSVVPWVIAAAAIVIAVALALLLLVTRRRPGPPGPGSDD